MIRKSFLLSAIMAIFIGGMVFATPSWMTPEMQEALAKAEALNTRMVYETRPERVVEVFAALDAEIARLESIPRRHRYFNAVQEILVNLRLMRDNRNTVDWSLFPAMLYSKLNVVRTTIYMTSQMR